MKTPSISPPIPSSSAVPTFQRGASTLEEYIAIQKEYNDCRSEDNPFNRLARMRADTLAAYITSISQPGEAPPSILDIGCREGYSLETLEYHFPNSRLVGVDIVPQFVEAARDKAEDVRQEDAHNLPFADNEFDWVFSSHTLEHCYDPKKAASEMIRIAKTGIFLVVPCETRIDWERNLSHEVAHDDPIDWLNLFRTPKFRLIFGQFSDHSDFQATFFTTSKVFDLKAREKAAEKWQLEHNATTQ